MFSPYYAWARRRGAADPHAYCAVNVLLHGPARRWTMTERGARAVSRDASMLAIGRSRLAWDGAALHVRLDECCAPLPRRVRGSLLLRPDAIETGVHRLDPAGRHRWHPIAPCARIEVAMDMPALAWTGDAYCDSNFGAAPLERDFASWSWSRAPGPDGTTILYDVALRDGPSRSLTLRYARQGGWRDAEMPAPVALPASRWGVPRRTRARPGAAPVLHATILDAPFYARSILAAPGAGGAGGIMHESLSLDRFRRPWVQAMLPFRMPRRA